MNNTTSKHDYEAARRAMIDSQLRTSGVNEEYILARMMAVPREDFVPEDKSSLAYVDRSISLDSRSFLASPLFYGKLLLEAAPSRDDRVLIIEGGTGYLTQLVSPLVSDVATVSAENAAQGELSPATFSLVLIDGAIEHLPDAVTDSLQEDGRIVSGLLLRQVTRLASGRKIAGTVTLQPVEDMGIPVLEPFQKPKSWTFS